MPKEHNFAGDRGACDRIAERDHAYQALTAQLVEATREEPRFCVGRYIVEEDKTAQLDASAWITGKAGKAQVVDRLAENGDANQLAPARA
jgi:hypothetical protein